MKRLFMIFFILIALAACNSSSNDENASSEANADIAKLRWDTSGGGDLHFTVIPVGDGYGVDVSSYDFHDVSKSLKITPQNSEVFSTVDGIFKGIHDIKKDTFIPKGETGTWTSITMTYSDNREEKIENIDSTGNLALIYDFVAEGMK